MSQVVKSSFMRRFIKSSMMRDALLLLDEFGYALDTRKGGRSSVFGGHEFSPALLVAASPVHRYAPGPKSWSEV
ncbi:Uncharacterized protein KF715C_pB440 (plasmid) [Pseudomonas putida]|jgi:hypothetical protein|uniref:Uncharacterized protein n=1 Tax=Pseudomonas putida TaxID=303 RepID=A0A1L7NNU1_PSEPU|nr:Uncharacterized protein KF715C_pB440 [Pseudomonas putida]